MRKFRVNKEKGLTARGIRKGLLILAALFILAGCSNPGSGLDNYPYEPDTPAPASHEGTFVSDHGSMNFAGDGKSIIIDFDSELASLTGLPEGCRKGTYTFLSGDLPPNGSFPVRYDIAHEMQITIDGQSSVIDVGIVSEDGKSSQVGINVVTPERIPMLFLEDGFISVLFQKEDNRFVTRFFFQESYGSDYDRWVICCLDYENGSYTVSFKPEGIKEEETVILQADKAFADSLKEILYEFNVDSWNGFDKKSEGVMDGAGFTLHVVFSDGSGIEANGYMEWPEHYGISSEAILELFSEACGISGI